MIRHRKAMFGPIANPSRRRTRRGVVLLLVLSLLVLMMLMGITFLIVSSQFLKAARAQSRFGQVMDNPQNDLEAVLYQLIRDTNVRSSLSGHSLLGDTYGFVSGDYLPVTSITVVTPQLGGQIIDLQFTSNANTSLAVDYYNGRVLTILDGPARHISTRVVDFVPAGAAGGPATMRVLALRNEYGAIVAPNVGDLFIVNGAAFNGTGAGLNTDATSGGNLDNQDLNGDGIADTARAIALLPHFVAYASGVGVPNQGGEDESYDAVDYQNMFMAMVPANASTSADIIPSFHRPSLVNYWQAQYPTWQTDLNFQRSVLMRPMPFDHPDFTGSNAAMAVYERGSTWLPGPDGAWGGPGDDDSDGTTNESDEAGFPGSDDINTLVYGPWDVDNDSDGIPDSIWVDAGLPIRQLDDGTMVKPLVAILIKDMDGRINLNAAGNQMQTDSSIQMSAAIDGPYPGGAAMISSVRGGGLGPAEIYFGHIFGNESNDIVINRYGPDQVPGRSNSATGIDDDRSQIGAFGDWRQLTRGPDGVWGNTGDDDSDGNADEIDEAGLYGSDDVLTGTVTPRDVWGFDALALDFAGRPYMRFAGTPGVEFDDPYELDLSLRGQSRFSGVDTPYTWADFEIIMRRLDGDAPSLPRRLLQSAPGTFGTLRNREMVTVDSRDIPVPNFNIPLELNTAPFVGGNVSILDLFVTKLQAGGATDVNLELSSIVPPDIRRGNKFDINKPHGDYRDTDGDDFVDEPDEAGDEQPWAGYGLPANFDAASFNNLNDDPIITDPQYARQIYARHLFCLMMAIADEGFFDSPDTVIEAGLTGPQRRDLFVRRLAQWAINVVDFCDADAAMSPFEYDNDPFNGWLVMDGDPATDEGTDRRIVWGCESSHLLIKEAIAFHDRRIKDTDLDTTGQARVASNGRLGDDDVDQYRIPQGSLFMEFYCPGDFYVNGPHAPSDLYVVDPATQTNSLDLGQFAPAGQHPTDAGRTSQYPVWRVAISQSHLGNPAMSPQQRSITNPDTTSFQPAQMDLRSWTGNVMAGGDVPIERYIWFGNRDPSASIATGGANLPAAESQRIYYNRLTDLVLPVGEYAVVGPRVETHIGSQTPGAPASPPDYLPSDQTIVLDATTLGGVETYLNNNGTNNPNTPPIASGALVDTKKTLTMIAAANPPTTWVDAANTAQIGLGNAILGSGINISEPTVNAPYPEPNSQWNTTAPNVFPVDTYYDQTDPMKRLPDAPFDSQPGTPLGNAVGVMNETGTTRNFKTAFLQRLANPTAPYHLTRNPYITVDWTPLDLTVFSGEENTNRMISYQDAGGNNVMDWVDPGDQDPFGSNPPEQFETRQRNGANQNIWQQSTAAPTAPQSVMGTDYFNRNMDHTLGYMNSAYGARRPTPAAYRGTPTSQPFPWITWFNRPFNAPTGLMQVPASSGSRLLHEFTMDNGQVAYSSGGGNNTWKAPFGHLLNFFHNSTTAGDSPNLYRLFEYVETPSPFVGSHTWLNPATFGGAGAGVGADELRPPYNRLSNFRDPGKVNINTIFDPFNNALVWEGVSHGLNVDGGYSADAHWAQLYLSRQGYGTGVGLNANFPTRFANPFRSSTGAYLGPLPQLQNEGVEASFFRPAPQATNAQNFTNAPLFNYTSTAQPKNAVRNSYFRYQSLARQNLLTTHSNVYAIWITVGYFEVDVQNPVPISNRFRDGYRFGQEAGALTGTTRRHRYFSVVDRSIPVAFEPGENHNVDKAIMIRRLLD